MGLRLMLALRIQTDANHPRPCHSAPQAGESSTRFDASPLRRYPYV